MADILMMLDILQENSEQTFFRWKKETAAEEKRAALEAHEAARNALLSYAEQVGLI